MGKVLTVDSIPKISVVMPVYNAEQYLREAIGSILSQTFTDYELLLVDDGSTDGSARIAQSIEDPRLRLVPNEKNEGIVATLNKGIKLARGEYIAIMHADDVSLPHRLEKQAQILDADTSVAMVAAKTLLIDSSGEEVGYWQEDCSAVTSNQIRELLPITNCISHPSVMIRRDVALTYRYNPKQFATEDYDLWLRLAADGRRIEKVDDVLLKYRVHPATITSRTSSDLYKELRTKVIFLGDAIRKGKTTDFHLAVLKYFIRDFFKINFNVARSRFLAAARYIMISVGKKAGTIYQKLSPRQHALLMFLSFSCKYIGGAERVHADIVASNIQKSPWVILANEWHDEPVGTEDFTSYRFSNISKFLHNPFTKNLAVGFFAGYINRAKSVVFGGNSVFFYQLMPYLSPDVFCVDFVHGFGAQIEMISLAHLPRINRRVVITPELHRALVRLYRRHGIPDRYAERIQMIDYGVEVPDSYRRSEAETGLTVLYVGRGTEEKRVHLVGRIARYVSERHLPVTVSLVGDVLESVEVGDREYCRFCGPVSDRDILDDLYLKSDILVITSRTEGLSLVKLEAMARGVVPVAVAVGGIPDHIRDGVSGFLVSPEQSEEAIVMDFCRIIEKLANDRLLLRKISNQALEFARNNFNRSSTLNAFARLFDRN